MTPKRSSSPGEEKDAIEKVKDLTKKIKQSVKKTLSPDDSEKPRRKTSKAKTTGEETPALSSLDEPKPKKTVKKAAGKKTAQSKTTAKSAAKKTAAATTTSSRRSPARKAVPPAEQIEETFSSAYSGERDEAMSEKVFNESSSEQSQPQPPDPIHIGISAWPSSPIGGGAGQPQPAPMYDPHADPRPLPQTYGKTRLTLLVRDPEWLFSFWEISEEDRNRNGLNGGIQKRMALRVYDITDSGDPTNASSYHDIVVTEMATSWYLHVARPSRHWVVDLGYYDAYGNFVTVARSNSVLTPSDRLSEVIDEQWMHVDEESFRRLIQMSSAPGMLGGSEMLGIEIGQRLVPQFMPGASELFSVAASQQKAPEALPFHLQVRYELIVYGATEPDAAVTLCGEPIRLRPDGTFTVRYDLPDGERTIDVKAVKSTGDQFREASSHIEKTSR